jgi:hypothetical protein
MPAGAYPAPSTIDTETGRREPVSLFNPETSGGRRLLLLMVETGVLTAPKKDGEPMSPRTWDELSGHEKLITSDYARSGKSPGHQLINKEATCQNKT